MKPWDKYEIALLIETYFNIENGVHARGNELKRLSVKLRRMALNRGMTIDAVYRNYNGMNRKVHNIGDIIMNAAGENMPQKKEFTEMVGLYFDFPDEYRAILEKAHKMCRANTPCGNERKEAFAAWLTGEYDIDEEARSVRISAIDALSAFCLKRGQTNRSLWEAEDVRDVNRVRSLLEKDRIYKIKLQKEIPAVERALKEYAMFVNAKSTADTPCRDPERRK